MPYFKVTYSFEGPQTAIVGRSAGPGWSESWHLSMDNLEAAVNFAKVPNQPGSWLPLRLAMLANAYRITKVRVTNALFPRQNKTVRLVGLTGTAGPAAQVNCGVLVDFTVMPATTNGVTHHSRRLFRGIPVSLINGDVINNTSPMLPTVREFFNLVGHFESNVAPPAGPIGPWLVEFQDEEVTPQNLVGFGIAPGDPKKIVVGNDFGPQAPGVRLRISGVKEPYFVNKVWTILGVGPQNAPYTLGQSRRNILGAWNNTGKVVLDTPLFRGANQYSIVGLGSRDTGRPPDRSRGRRSRA